MKTKYNILLLFILVLAGFLRLFQLGSNPPHLTPDEAALGYNAYSILKTGKDEYGEFLPIIFKSFGDYKPGFYVYTAIPFVAVFGLTEFAVRLPSALAGILAVYLVFKIVSVFINQRKNFANIRLKRNEKKSKNFSSEISGQSVNALPYIAALCLAISPWHIHFSRGAWEVNLSLTLTLAGIYTFLISFKNTKWLPLSALLFSTTLITYQGAKLSTLIVLLVLAITFFSEIKQILLDKTNTKLIITSLIIGLIISLPVLMSFMQGKTGRLKVFSVFSYTRPQEYLDEQLNYAQIEKNSAKYYLYYSESLNTLRGILGRWFNHFSGKFLLFEGDWQNPRHSSPYHGMLYVVDGVFLLLGLVYLIKSKSKISVFVVLWLALSVLPAALSRDQVHAVRSLNMVVPLTLVVSFGVYSFYRFTGNKSLFRTLSILGLVILYTISFVYFLDSYFMHQTKNKAAYWEYGYKQAMEYLIPVQQNYEKIYVRQSFSQPYIYYLFYSKYDPAAYQKQANLIDPGTGDVGWVEKIDNICFCAINWSQNRGDKGVLFIADPIRIPPQDSMDGEEFRVHKEIKYPNGVDTALRIVEVLSN